MQLIYNNSFIDKDIFEYKYILIGMNYTILIKRESVNILPIEHKFFNFKKGTFSGDVSILQNFSVIIPLTREMLERFKAYKYFLLQYNTMTDTNEFGFVNKVAGGYEIKEKIVRGKILNEIEKDVSADVLSFIKRLL